MAPRKTSTTTKQQGEAEKAAHVNAPAEEPKEMTGGAVVTKVEIEPVAADAPDGFAVITTAPGTLGAQGVVPVGTRVLVTKQQFSKAWMQPENSEARQALMGDEA